jgi:hypothetical protein
VSDTAPQESFEYGMLDEQTREIVLHKTDESHRLMIQTAGSIIALGENLVIIQRHLPDMKFSAWLRAEFDLSRQSADNFMRVVTRLGSSCKIVFQLPTRVLYELASSSDAVIEQVEMEQLSSTIDSIKAAREVKQQARVEVETRQATIEQLILEIERPRRRIAGMAAPQIEVREVEKLVGPPKMSLQLDTLRHKIATLTWQRDTLSEQVSQLQELARASALVHLEGDHERLVCLNWFKLTSEFQRSLRSIFSRCSSFLDVLAFEADDWTRLSQIKKMARRLLEERTWLTRRKTDGLSTGLKSSPQMRSSSRRPTLSEI